MSNKNFALFHLEEILNVVAILFWELEGIGH